LTAWHLIA